MLTACPLKGRWGVGVLLSLSNVNTQENVCNILLKKSCASRLVFALLVMLTSQWESWVHLSFMFVLRVQSRAT